MDLFGTAGIRGPVARITPEQCLLVGRAYGTLVSEWTDAENGRPADPTVVLGRDGRVTGETLAAAVQAGLTSAGVDVLTIGQVPTPALAFASQHRYGVMVTASHNPPADNGIKLFVDAVEIDASVERRLEQSVTAQPGPATWDEWGQGHRADVMPEYRDAVVSYARAVGTDMSATVAVDCGTGMAGPATPAVLSRLGANVQALNANVDGYFPARESKPTAESLEALRDFVADGPAAFGIGHDGDGDRIVIVDGDGEVVHEDTVLAILAEAYTRRSDADDPVVVTTPNASARIDERVRAAGGRVERVRLGALHEGIRDVRSAGGAETSVAFAAEPWKHIHPDFGGWIDAIASAAVFGRLVAADGLDSLRDPVQERPYRKESLHCPDEAKEAVMSTLREELPEAFPEANVETEYGIRLTFPDGAWVLVRPSGTEPYVRLYVESESVEKLLASVRDIVVETIEERTD